MELLTSIYENVQKKEYWPWTKHHIKMFEKEKYDLEHVDVEVDGGVKSGEEVR